MGNNFKQFFDSFNCTKDKYIRTEYYNPFFVRHRKKTTKKQLDILEKRFLTNPRPDARLRKFLAEQLGMSARSIQIWFQNRRAKEKKILEKRMRNGYWNLNYGTVGFIFNAFNNSLYESPFNLVFNNNVSNQNNDDSFSTKNVNEVENINNEHNKIIGINEEK